MPPVAVLCAAPRSIYHWLPGVEVYDRHRDARTFPGQMPVVAHPPCRGWSAKLRHQAKPEAGERELGLLCCEFLRQCGGILEQPADSALWPHGRLPWPGESDGDLWSVEVQQCWWGHPAPKPTWLCFSFVPEDQVLFPAPQPAMRSTAGMSAAQRSATPRALARWLVQHARLVYSQSGIRQPGFTTSEGVAGGRTPTIEES